MSVIKFIDPKLETIPINVKLTIEQVSLINKFILINQSTKNTHGPMSLGFGCCVSLICFVFPRIECLLADGLNCRVWLLRRNQIIKRAGLWTVDHKSRGKIGRPLSEIRIGIERWRLIYRVTLVFKPRRIGEIGRAALPDVARGCSRRREGQYDVARWPCGASAGLARVLRRRRATMSRSIFEYFRTVSR
jgi:hypothetical protein